MGIDLGPIKLAKSSIWIRGMNSGRATNLPTDIAHSTLASSKVNKRVAKLKILMELPSACEIIVLTIEDMIAWIKPCFMASVRKNWKK